MTENYYKENVIDFFDSTSNVDMSTQYDVFLKYLKGDKVLDLGCGSGRDSYHFKNLGLTTTSIDYTSEFNSLAKDKFNVDIINMDMRKMDFKDEFNGIWACASLLHLNINELKDITYKLSESLKKDGILYASFKEGDFSGHRNGRFFTDLEIDLAKEIFEKNFEIIQYFYTTDNRPNRNETWLNLILLKKF